MSTLLDVSKEAGVSIASVSLYVNGKSKGRVSEETQKRIQLAIEKTGYKPTGKKISSLENNIKTIAILWSESARFSFIGSFFSGFQSSLKDLNLTSKYDFVIHPFKPDELYKKKEILLNNEYAGAVIANTSYSDIQYLRSMSMNIPVVLLNRKIPSIHGVYVNNNKIAYEAAKIIQSKGYNSIATVMSANSSTMISERFVKFIEYCKELNISILNEHQFQVEDSIIGGQIAAHDFLKLQNKPKAIFSSTDSIAYGIENTLLKQNFTIPKDVAILSYGFNVPEITKYAYIPISTVDMPTFELARECILLLHKIIDCGIDEVQHKEMSHLINMRESM